MAVPYKNIQEYVRSMNTALFDQYCRAIGERKQSERDEMIRRLLFKMTEEIKILSSDQQHRATELLVDLTKQPADICRSAIKLYRNNIDGLQENDPLD